MIVAIYIRIPSLELDIFASNFENALNRYDLPPVDLIDDTTETRLFCKDLFGRWFGFFKQLTKQYVRLPVRISSEEGELKCKFLEFYHRSVEAIWNKDYGLFFSHRSRGVPGLPRQYSLLCGGKMLRGSS
jgi:hypothetical protein